MQTKSEQILQYLKYQFKQGDIIIKLIYLNFALFLSYSIFRVFEFIFRIPLLSSFFENWLSIPAEINQLSYKFYTLLSYQFIHFELLHILINMFMLFFFGKMLLSYISFKKLLPLYLLGGIVGGLVFVLFKVSGLILIADKPLVGASASIMALMGALAMIIPDYNMKFFFFDVKLKWVVIGFAVINFLNIYNPDGAASGILHLSGIAFGYAYMYLDKKGISLAKPVNRLINTVLSWFNKNPQPKVSFVNPNKRKESSKKSNQKEIDAILDKIAKNGYNSLTKKEKEMLFKASHS